MVALSGHAFVAPDLGSLDMALNFVENGPQGVLRHSAVCDVLVYYVIQYIKSERVQRRVHGLVSCLRWNLLLKQLTTFGR